jgi:uncharacterized membrane protein YhaH (DUF805 family)
MNWYLKVLKQYADFNGRARRKEYWMFFLFNIIIAMILGFIEGVADINPTSDDSILASIYQLAILIPSIAVGVRRMHDVGKSGWFILIPIYNFILAVTDGDKGSNEYGSDPKEITE